jgi:hypothetical protein
VSKNIVLDDNLAKVRRILVISNRMVTSPKDEEVTTFIWFSNQTRDGMAPFYLTLEPNKKWSGSILSSKHENGVIPFLETRMERLRSTSLLNQIHPKPAHSRFVKAV